MELSQARQFLARVLPWPDEHNGEFLGLHWTFDDGRNEKPRWSGTASTSLDALMRGLKYGIARNGTRDVYVCLSSQAEAQRREAANGWVYYTPIRNRQNARHLKSLFLDIDVKAGGGYASLPEAATDLARFIKEVDLPRPSIMVASGGGLHVYWVLSRAITVAEWQPWANALAEATQRHGLKCDTQVTVDAARVLRVPDTHNFKQDPPRPVHIVGTPTDFDYDLERLERALSPYAVRTRAPVQPELPPRAPIAGQSDLAAGVEVKTFAPINLDAAAKECPFIASAILTGGEHFSNPLWNLTTLLATFCDDARAQAHRMACAHKDYTPESTDKLFDRKEEERERLGLKWPHCATIRGAGADQCATCPHLAENKTPFHHVPAPVITSGVTEEEIISAPSLFTVTQMDMPKGFRRDGFGLVQRQVANPDGSFGFETIHSEPIVSPRLQKNPWVLSFFTAAEAGKMQQVEVPLGAIGTMELRKVLGEQGMILHPGPRAPLIMSEFLMAWVQKLKKTKDAVTTTVPFGWNILKNGKIEGFCYGGNVWTPDGSRPASNADPVLTAHYSPVGDLETWLRAARLITDQKRPELDAILASAFAAPLVRFAGQEGMMMSIHSDSGTGKTTALRIAQAVWGDPVRARQTLNDTQNSVIGKMGALRAIPIYWDELKTDEDTKKFVNLAFQLTIGKEKSRMTATSRMRDVGLWQTLLVVASNDSLLDHIISHTKTNTAGLYRTFEYEALPRSEDGPGRVPRVDAQRITASVNDNFGQAGLAYAKHLGAHFEELEAEVAQFCRELDAQKSVREEERFWVDLVSCICVGARVSNRLGLTEIDEERLEKFMLEALDNMRMERSAQPVDMNSAANVSNIVAQFFQQNASRHMLWTNRIHTTRGRPTPGTIRVERDTSKLDGIYVHVGTEDKLVRVSTTALTEWLTHKGYSRHAMIEALTKQFGCRRIQGRIGGGTQFAGPVEYMFEFDLSKHAELNFLDEA